MTLLDEVAGRLYNGYHPMSREECKTKGRELIALFTNKLKAYKENFEEEPWQKRRIDLCPYHRQLYREVIQDLLSLFGE